MKSPDSSNTGIFAIAPAPFTEGETASLVRTFGGLGLQQNRNEETTTSCLHFEGPFVAHEDVVEATATLMRSIDVTFVVAFWRGEDVTLSKAA